MTDKETVTGKEQHMEFQTPPPSDSRIRIKALQREQILKRLQSEINNISAIESMSLSQLEVKVSMLERQYESFDQLQAQLETLDESQFCENHRDTAENAYFAIKSRILEKISSHRQAHDSFMSSTHQVTNIQSPLSKKSYLPKLQLGKFSGIHKEWLEFFNMFKVLVDDDHELPPLAKFQYLRSCLTDKAARLVQSLDITPQNYTKAIDMLKARYDNKRYIFQSHITDMFSIESVQKPSMDSLREFIDNTNSNLRAIQSLASDTQIANGIILHLVVSKLDSETQSKWEEEVSLKWDVDSLETLRLPTWDNLSSFLERRCKSMDIIETTIQKPPKSSSHHNTSSNNRSRSSFKSTPPQSTFVVAENHHQLKCLLCDESPAHNAFKCAKFLNLNQLERYNLIKSKKLCLNCLSANHIATKCPSLNRCQNCRSSHHTLLHRVQSNTSPAPPPSPTAKDTTHQLIASSQAPISLKVLEVKSEVLLGTARVNLCSSSGIEAVGRALLDSGSQLNFVTERMSQHLRLPRKKINIEINGIGETSAVAQHMCTFKVKSLVGGFTVEIDAIILPSITSHQPHTRIDITRWNLPGNIKLADECFNKPGAVDLLLGTQVFYRLLLVGQIQLENAPTLQKTHLGWVVAGSFSSPAARAPTLAHIGNLKPPLNYQSYVVSSSQTSLNEIVERFWKMENCLSEETSLSEEEQYCEYYFEKTTTRCTKTNKFIVRLPFKTDPSTLGKSFDIARKRLSFLNNKLSRNKDLEDEYTKFMTEYIELHHMDSVPGGNYEGRYFIPHHCVVKPDSSTTRLRVVFDASCSTDSGKSLNDVLCVGPTIQDDIFTILSRFRLHKHVLVADIAKMYRQVLVDKRDAPWQSILWRNTNSDSPDIYQLQTVTYGTSSAPYLATKCLQKVAQLEENRFPIGSAVVKRDFYVDNLMTGANTLENLAEIKQQVVQLLDTAGFPLRKFSSNCLQIMESIPPSDREEVITIDNMLYVKTLGLKWSPVEDAYSFHYTKQLSSKRTTKRQILSHTCSFFDPLGLLNPVIVTCKLLIQLLWSLKLKWDESVSQDIYYRWEEIKHQLEKANTIKIPRFVLYNQSTVIHAFSDASTKAYGACFYAVTSYNGSIHPKLLCAKSKVAPLKQVSLPRLELCAALLLAKLLPSVIRTLPASPKDIVCWSDSTITLAWISGESSRWTTFVANRVTKIQSLTRNARWRHVPTSLNPADFLSRGTTVEKIIKSELWFNGPDFLQTPVTQWPSNDILLQEVTIEVRPPQILLAARVTNDLISDHKYVNDFKKLMKTFSYINRFIAICRKETVETGSVTVEEMDAALITICRSIQHTHFKEEFRQLLNGNKLNISRNKLMKLSPFMHNNIIRVGGRLENSSLPFSAKHPLLLPSSHPFVHTLIRYFHMKNLHAGTLTLHNILRNTFWIINARNVIKGVLRKCILCFRMKPKIHSQIMADLPQDRVNPSLPFEVCGIDYCGPLLMTQQIRKRGPIKVYISIFICFSTKAVHLELVPDLTTIAFISALKRFVSRRGRCRIIYSDNATNFVGANKELKELLEAFLTEEHKTSVFRVCRNEGITWKFIPPRSPHFGGLWESAVKQTKYYLRRAIGTHILNQDDLHTLCCQSEAIINSRPLTQLSSDPNDLTALTPSHFLLGRPAETILSPPLSDPNTSLLKKYRLAQWIQQQFWQRWSQEYLNTLQRRSKWTTEKPNINVNDLVVLRDESTPPLKWPLARVVEVTPGKDGNVRVVTVKTADNIFKRAVAKVCKLPLDNEEKLSSDLKA